MEIIKSILLASQILIAQGDFNSTRLIGLEACYPNWDIYETSKLISQAWNEEKEYFLIYLYLPNFPAPDTLVISRPLKGRECTQEWFNHMGDDVSLYRALNERQIARQLTLGFYEKEIQTSGRESLQNQIDELAKINPNWREENIWALKQLGFSIPPNVNAID